MAVLLELISKLISSLQKLAFKKHPIPNHAKSKILNDAQLPDHVNG